MLTRQKRIQLAGIAGAGLLICILLGVFLRATRSIDSDDGGQQYLIRGSSTSGVPQPGKNTPALNNEITVHANGKLSARETDCP